MDTRTSRRRLLGGTLLGAAGGMAAFSLPGNDWLRRLLLPSQGGLAGAEGAATSGLASALRGLPLGTYELLADALRGGAGLFKVQEALAAGPTDATKEWAVVTIKVVNLVHTPLVFKLGRLEGQRVTTGTDVKPVSERFSTAKAHMMSKKVDEISDNPRYRNLRFNKWFADILHTGQSDSTTAAGAPAISSATLLPASGLTGVAADTFPESVAIQAGLHLMKEYLGKNHSLLNFRVRNTEGDLAHFLQKYKVVQSPFGVTVFNMGNTYDKAEGATGTNALLGDTQGDTETAKAFGFTVGQLVGSLEQSVAGGYGDTTVFEDNLTARFDKLVDREPKLRRALLEGREQVAATLSRLKAVADNEGAAQSIAMTAAPGFGALQSGGKGDPTLTPATVPSNEFVSQCLYVAHALRMEGRPMRNFSLFLNTADNDGNLLDSPAFGGPGEGIRAYTTVEGMRQLAVGLNVLAKVIAEKKNVVVVVLSEGGRDAALGDNAVSFGLVLAPGGAGGLTDTLYANEDGINQPTGSIVTDPGAANTTDESTFVKWTSDGLMSDAGMSLRNQKATTTGDWQLGVAEFLAEKMGVPDTMKNQQRYVKLKRA